MRPPHPATSRNRPTPAVGRFAFCLFLTLPALALAGDNVCPVPRPAIPNPALDGWNSEAFSDQAQSELKHLLKPVTEGKSDFEELSGSFALRPGLREIHRSATATIRRAPAPDKTPAATTFAAAMAPVLAAFTPGAPLHLKVKTSGVHLTKDAKTGTQKTVHLLHFDGPFSGGRREMNSTITAEWDASDAAGPRLTGLTCQAWEEADTPDRAPWFSDQTAPVLAPAADAASQFSGGNGYYRLRLQSTLPFFKFGHNGIALADVNGDGLEDVYVCQPGGLPNRLLLHQPDHTVRDVSAEWNADLLDNTQCALFADLDNDGDPDLIVATTGPLTIFENVDGRTFQPRVRLSTVQNAYSLTAVDYDGDGKLDIYAGRYFPSAEEGGELAVPMPHFDANNGGPNFLIRNDGPATGGGWRNFRDATAETGLGDNNHRFTYAAVWDDFNRDGLPDLYLANDFGRNNLYLQTRKDGKIRFQDVTDTCGLKDGAFGMSASSGDFNRDGWPDIHLGAMWSSAGNRITTQDNFREDINPDLRARFQRLARGNCLFQNAGKPEAAFQDVSVASGVTVGRWSWASLFADFDNDAWPDLLVANGFVSGAIPDDL